MKGKRVLVTGGLGFIGSNLVPELRNRNHQVWVCDLKQRWQGGIYEG